MRKDKKKHKLIRQLELSGIEIEQLTYEHLTLRTNLSKCLWNALVIFFFVFGLVGFFTTAFSLPCNMFKLTVFTAFISTYFSLFYLRKYCFNIGYILTLFSIVYYSIRHYSEINSGYSAILNLIIIKIDEELNLTNLREFTEEITYRYVTITACMIVIITMLACLFNMWVSRRNSILYPLFIVLLVMEFSIYLNDDFSYFYLLVILLALTLFIFTKQNDELPVDNKKHQKTYITKRKRIFIKGRRVELKGNLYGALAFTLATLFVSLIAFTFIPATYVEANSELKNKTDEIVSIVAMRGFSALFGSEKSGTGGMNNGTFGDVKSISFDYETDLEVTFVPYTWRPVYIPTFSANTYDSVNRRWYQNNVMITSTSSGTLEYGTYDILEQVSEYLPTYILLNQLDPVSVGEDRSASASFMIKNVAAGTVFPASLYYDGNSYNYPIINIGRNDAVIFQYTPLLFDYHNLPTIEDSMYFMSDYDREEYVKANYLYVPIKLQNDLQQICIEQDFGGTTAEVVDQIIDFLKEGYQYSINPGATPDNEDFVLYFLEEKKQGFCVHFASSACLMLRQMGIPAKYVEGYSFDYSAYEDATLFSSSSLDLDMEIYRTDSSSMLTKTSAYYIDSMDWYDGYNPTNFNDPVSIDLTDANAHAWVEVYFEGFGWVPVEFTVGSMAEDGDMVGLSSMLNNLSAGSSGGDSGILNNVGINQAAQTVGRLINYGLRNMVLIVIIITAVILVLRKVKLAYMVYYSRENKRAVYQYRFLSALVKKDLSRRYKDRRIFYDNMIVSHSLLKYILNKEYGMSCTSAERAINRYEVYNYSESGDGVNIDNLTDSFLNVSGHIIERFGFLKRFIYRLYLYMPRKRSNKDSRSEEITIENDNEVIEYTIENDIINPMGFLDEEEVTEPINLSNESGVASESDKSTYHKRIKTKWFLAIMGIISAIIIISIIICLFIKADIFGSMTSNHNDSLDDTDEYNNGLIIDSNVHKQVNLSDYTQLIEFDNEYFTQDITYKYSQLSAVIVEATYMGRTETSNIYNFRLNDVIRDNVGKDIGYDFSLNISGVMSDAFPELEIGDHVIIPLRVYSASSASANNNYGWGDYSLFYVKSDGTIFSRFTEFNNYDGYDVAEFKELIRNKKSFSVDY